MTMDQKDDEIDLNLSLSLKSRCKEKLENDLSLSLSVKSGCKEKPENLGHDSKSSDIVDFIEKKTEVCGGNLEEVEGLLASPPQRSKPKFNFNDFCLVPLCLKRNSTSAPAALPSSKRLRYSDYSNLGEGVSSDPSPNSTLGIASKCGGSEGCSKANLNLQSSHVSEQIVNDQSTFGVDLNKLACTSRLPLLDQEVDRNAATKNVEKFHQPSAPLPLSLSTPSRLSIIPMIDKEKTSSLSNVVGSESTVKFKMPCVKTTEDGPNGRTVNGFMFFDGKGELGMVCVCHGWCFSPAEFVQHSGRMDSSTPLKHIRVVYEL